MLDFDNDITEGLQDYIVANAYEDLVKQNVITMAKYMEMCTCGKCLSDVCALVLNQIPPNYVTTRKGEILSQLENSAVNDKQIDLTVKVVHALHLVKDSPRH